VAHDRTFRFGVTAFRARSGREIAEKARRAEDLGYSTLFMPDHFVGTELAPMVTISFAAAATEKLRIGTLVVANDFRHPALLAKEAATIDVLSDGRLELGLGTGWMRVEYDALSLPYDPPATRVARLGEAIEVIKRAWGRDPFDFKGDQYAITGYDGTPKPVQQPHPPILIGGGGPAMLRLAGREADIVGVNPNLRAGEVGPDALESTLGNATARKIQWIREGAGERFDDIELQIRYFLAAITDDARGLAAALAPGFDLTVDEALSSGVALVGTVDEVCDTLLERRDEWGVSYVVLSEDNLEAFAPVVARLAGT
jgi:probable F420-dependent oxidoreductase